MGTVHRVLVVQRVVNYLLDSGDVVLILKLCVVMMENIAALAVCLFSNCCLFDDFCAKSNLTTYKAARYIWALLTNGIGFFKKSKYRMDQFCLLG